MIANNRTSSPKATLRYELAMHGLCAANRGCVFWTRSDAFQALNMTRNNIKANTAARAK